MAHRRRLTAVLLLVLVPAVARAACNLIPQATPAFRATRGTVDRPFAAPGDFVDVTLRSALCDGASPGFGGDASQHAVTLLFEPGGKTKAQAVVLSLAPCAGLTSQLAACGATSGIGGVSCVEVTPSDLALLTIGGAPHLRFRFPDTDALLVPASDGRTFSGPTTIAVHAANGPLPCALATASCDAQAGALGLVACVDNLYAADGTCASNPNPVFPSFTALPRPNDFQADCFSASPPCTATATEVRLALDTAGNLYLPVLWSGVLVAGTSAPVPRTLRATVRPPVPFRIPDPVFLRSFTPEGQPLPPIFEPQADPNVTNPDVVTLFGTADAPSTVLRVSHRRGACAGGAANANACVVDRDCPGGTCVNACAGGANDGNPCAKASECPGGRCGELYSAAVFAALAGAGGPVAIPRIATPLPGACQLEPHGPCTTNADCPGPGNLCVVYGFEARNPVGLESLTQGTSDVLAFTAAETLDLTDRTGDGDTNDTVVTLSERATGRTQVLGAPDGFAGGAPLPACGLAGTPEGRAVAIVDAAPFRVPAIASEGDVVAFVESEIGEGYCDENGDGDRGDGILRVFTVPGTERTAAVTPPRAVDPALVVNGKSIAVSNGRVFFRSDEAAMATQGLELASVGSGFPGTQTDNSTFDARISRNGRWVVFTSFASNVVPGDTNGSGDVFVRDRMTGSVTRASVEGDGSQSDGFGARTASVSEDGRIVAFDSQSQDLVPGDTNVCFGQPCSDVFVRDSDSDENGIFDEVGGTTTTRVSVGPGGVQGDSRSTEPVVSGDGRYVVFQSDATNLVADDTNGQPDIFVHDRVTGVTERINVGNDGSENVGVESENRSYDISVDGRWVVFDERTVNLPSGVPFESEVSAIDVFLRDRVAGVTSQVTVDSEGFHLPLQFALYPRMSSDGRWITYTSDPGVGGTYNIAVLDRSTGDTDVVNRQPDGTLPTGQLSLYSGVSDDGRFVSFVSDASTMLGPGKDTNGKFDVFIRDRALGSTERVNVGPGGAESIGDFAFWPSFMTAQGEVMFISAPDDLLPGGADTNGQFDVFIRGAAAADPLGIDALLFADGTLDDTVLEVLDAGSGAVTTLCPATQVAVAGASAAFLRPESATGTAACPGGSLNAPDADVTDEVVHLWPGAGLVVNLGRAATAVALSSTTVAALVSEAGEGADLNDDGDTSDAVVQVHAVGGGDWTSTMRQGDSLATCGAYVAFLTSEAAQDDADLNGDGDAFDRVMQVYNPSSGALVNTGQAADDFVCSDQVIAFRTSEASQGHADLQSGSGTVDPLFARNGLQAWDLTRPACVSASPPADCLVNSRQAIRICTFPACDPTTPYRVSGTKVKFLTSECDQRGGFTSFCTEGGSDLNRDFDALDLILQSFDVADGTVAVIGGVSPDAGNPLDGGGTSTAPGAVFESTGRCIEPLAETCAAATDCPQSGAACESGHCIREHRTCVVDTDCPPGIPCTNDTGGIVPASPDTDGDGSPDHVDDCVATPNADQVDTDDDGVGDACDLATCGDGVLAYDEECDGAADAACAGACQACRCTVCGNVVVDPKAKVTVKTRNAAGQLSAKFAVLLGAYAGEPVSVVLADADSPVIAAQAFGTLAGVGKPPFKKWRFKSAEKTGLLGLEIKAAGASQPGMFKIKVKAKRWFTATAANLPAAALTLDVGTACFRIAATQVVP